MFKKEKFDRKRTKVRRRRTPGVKKQRGLLIRRNLLKKKEGSKRRVAKKKRVADPTGSITNQLTTSISIWAPVSGDFTRVDLLAWRLSFVHKGIRYMQRKRIPRRQVGPVG